MILSETKVPTASASRYLQQLSKHWSHKFDVTYSETASVIPFTDVPKAELHAEPDHLHIVLTVLDEESLERMQTARMHPVRGQRL